MNKKIVLLIAIEALAVVFAIAGAATCKAPNSNMKTKWCDTTNEFCSLFRAQEASLAMNIITVLLCCVCVVLLVVAVFSSAIYEKTSPVMKTINLSCAIFELVALIVLPVLFNNANDGVIFNNNDIKVLYTIIMGVPKKNIPDGNGFFATTFLSMLANIAAAVCLFIFKL